MGVDFSVRVVYGALVDGQDVPWETVWENDDSLLDKDNEIRVYTNGCNYFNCKSMECVIGYSEIDIDRCSNPGIFSLTLKEDRSKIIDHVCDKHNIPVKDFGYFILPEWS